MSKSKVRFINSNKNKLNSKIIFIYNLNPDEFLIVQHCADFYTQPFMHTFTSMTGYKRVCT